ncbi:ESX-1 secretion-associated protein [Planosporangium flavigriseum]|nr:ESX-1 secretion-associated protein [Planosporangium flavigriseum]
MMGTEGGLVQFPVAVVQQHAGTVDRVSDAVETARSAVHAVTMDAHAYGQLCQFLPALLNPVFGLAVDTLYRTVDSLQETATRLRTAATNTEYTDVSSAQRMNAAGPRIELPL